MKSREEILNALRLAKPELERDFGVARIALFGSYARGDATDDSDVDVLVEVAPSIGLRFVDLADRIEEILALPTDVVSRRSVSPRHWKEIHKELLDVA